MGTPENNTALFKCSVRFQAADPGGVSLVSGTGEARLFEEELQVWPQFGDPCVYPYRDVLEVQDSDYRVKVTLESGEFLELRELGYRYEDFTRELRRLRSELMIKDMLMSESLLKDETSRELPGFRGVYRSAAPAGNPEECEVRLYVSALVIIPRSSDPVRIPYSEISSAQAEDYSLALATESGQSYEFFRFGRDFEPLARYLSRAMKELSERSLELCKDLFPAAPSKHLWSVSRLMKEGRAAKRLDVEAVSPDLWPQLEKRLEGLGLKSSYDFLSSLAQRDRMAIGFKRGLASQFEEQYVWFLAPIGEGMGKPGNAIAMEAASPEGSAKATYFFRFMPRNEYKSAAEAEVLQAMDRAISLVNRCMIDVNFRREPIYLPDEKLLEPAYVRYLHSVRLMPSLRALRSAFIGRAMHVSEEQWKRDVLDLLSFNVGDMDDSAKWRRSSRKNEEDNKREDEAFGED